MNITPEQQADTAKVTLAWASVWSSNWFSSTLNDMGIRGWGDASQAAAFLFSLCLIFDFFWRRFFRKFAERKWPKRFPPRRSRRRTDFLDTSDHMDLDDQHAKKG